ncbi:MAG: hypothetical protein KIT54_07755 [Phycisphaeraceae bacterium]|nr:hypothetical protein [Phycisphaeraceae bacterium]
MPWGDWQFWVVTAAALGALAMIVRLVRAPGSGRRRTGLTISAPRRDHRAG